MWVGSSRIVRLPTSRVSLAWHGMAMAWQTGKRGKRRESERESKKYAICVPRGAHESRDQGNNKPKNDKEIEASPTDFDQSLHYTPGPLATGLIKRQQSTTKNSLASLPALLACFFELFVPLLWKEKKPQVQLPSSLLPPPVRPSLRPSSFRPSTPSTAVALRLAHIRYTSRDSRLIMTAISGLKINTSTSSGRR